MSKTHPVTVPVQLSMDQPVRLNYFAFTAAQAAEAADRIRSAGHTINKEKYRVSFLIDPKTQGALLEQIRNAVLECKRLNPGAPGELCKPLTPGGDESFPDLISFSCSSIYPPYLTGPDGRAKDVSGFYRGALVQVGLSFVHYKNGVNFGITAYCNGVKFFQDAPVIETRSSAKVIAQMNAIQAQLPAGYIMAVPVGQEREDGSSINGQPITAPVAAQPRAFEQPGTPVTAGF